MKVDFSAASALFSTLLMYLHRCIMGFVKITWDEQKAESNLKKHQVSFDEAATVFSNSLARLYPDSHEFEDRMLLVGHSADLRLLLVVYIEKAEESFRIISARKATANERRNYEEGI